jgi:ribonuclease G
MAKNILVISCDIAETRVALIENGIIAELHIERRGAQPRGGAVGDIYLGKVTRVLPGLQAAFVDIGLERAAFLHVEDLIRPDDFETYLAGGRKHALGASTANGASSAEETPDESDVAAAEAAEEEAATGESVAAADAPSEEPETPAEVVPEAAEGGVSPALAPRDEDTPEDDSDEEVADREGNDDEDAQDDLREPPEDGMSDADDVQVPPDAESGDTADERAAAPLSEGPVSEGLGLTGLVAEEPTATELGNPESEPPPPSGSRSTAAEAEPDLEPLDELLDDPNLPGFTVSEPGEPMPRAPAPRLARRDDRGGGGGGDRRRRRRGRGRDRDRERERGRGGREGDRPPRENRPRQSAAPGRLSKSTPIRDVVKEGQEIIVQITKEPISTKGARCSSHISLPGRYVVYLPTLEHVGVSKRIGSDKERARLRDTIESMKPPTGGLIVRTVAEGLTKKQLKQDVGYLVRLWGEVAKNREVAKAPKNLLSELDIVLKTARDLFTDDVDQIVIDDRGQYDRLCRFVEMFMPDRLKDIVYFNEDEPIFDEYGIEDEIARALSRKVPLPSGGYLIIDEAEALTAIDVNTGRFVGKGSKDMEETILKTNLEAVQEIAYQLRFRNIGGLIILDLIDMEKPSNREKVRKTLEEILQRDKAKTTLNRISELGLIEMTRKRTRESLGRLLHEPCFYCDGTGHLQSKETVAFEILREIRRRRQDLPGYTVIVNCHPAVADLLTGSEKSALQEAESRYMRRIQVTMRTEYHLEQFDLVGK